MELERFTAAQTSNLKGWASLLLEIPGYDPIATAAGCYFVPALATRAIAFFPEHLTFSKGKWARKPFYLERWQAAIVANLMGWVNEDGTRRYRELFLLIPRKNGKTEFVAGLGLMFTFEDGEDGAENYCAATEKNQASILWNVARVMVERSPNLSKRAKIYTALTSIEYREMNSFLKPLSSEVASKHGYNAHFIAMDELHTQNSPDLLEVLETSQGAREQPLLANLTTSDFDRPSLCNEKQDWAEDVRDGEIDDETFLPVLFLAGKDDDWKDEKTWYKANPNLGVSLNIAYMRRKAKKAAEIPSFLNTFKRLHLNIKTSSTIDWIAGDDWQKCAGLLEHNELYKTLMGQECYMGIDLATTTDLSSISLWFHKIKTILTFPFAPEGSAQKRSERKNDKFYNWSDAGYLHLTNGNAVDYDAMAKKVDELHIDFKIKKIGIDPYNASHITQQLTAGGCAEVYNVRQGFLTLSAPTKEIERMVMKGELTHGGHPVMKWCVSNVVIEIDAAENQKPTKKKSKDKIDCAVSLICAMAVEISDREERKPSIYETRAPIVIRHGGR